MKIKFDSEKIFKNIIIISSAAVFIIMVAMILCYLLFLPKIVESNVLKTTLNKVTKEFLDADLKYQNPKLKTYLAPKIDFSIDNLVLKNNSQGGQKELLNLQNVEFSFGFNKIFNKELEIKKLKASKLIVKADDLIDSIKIKEQNQNPPAPLDWKINLINSDISLDEFNLSYFVNDKKTHLDIKLDDTKIITNENDIKKLKFNLDGKIIKNNKQYVSIKSNCTDKIDFDFDKIKVNDLEVKLNDSIIKINSDITADKISLNAKSDKFLIDDIFDLVNSDFIIPNGQAMLSPLITPKGSVKFDVNMINNDLSGFVYLNNASAKLKDVSNIPLNVTSGKIKITKDEIEFVDFDGFYGKNKNNKIKIAGTIKDYYKTFDSNIIIDSVITNEFFKDYLSKLIANTVLYVSKPSGTRVIYKSKNNVMNITWLAKISKGVNFGVSEEKSALSDYDRAVMGEFELKDDTLDIKNINYYIAPDIKRGVKLSPIIVFSALMKLDGRLDKISVGFGREMPCEFLNVFIGQKLFKKGTIKGNIEVLFKNAIPYLNADMVINKTLIPTQRMYIKTASLNTKNSLINVDAKGRFKRASFDFKGKIKNELKTPIIIKNLNLDIDNLDVERILASFNNQQSNQSSQSAQTKQSEAQIDAQNKKINSEEDLMSQSDDYMFDTSLLRIEDCNFSLQKGNYKEIDFGNIKAKLTLNDKGILKIQSNKFDIAKGISTLKVECDLQKLKYYIRLGVKGIDSNLMAKVLFNLDKEITGNADGLIELNGDETLRLNGFIKFLVHQGTIGKIGLVEYVLKIASVFRNPVVMVSPGAIMDIVSIPEGKFDKIQGEIDIKNNVLSRINIQSYSSTLSALIRGRFDMERHDASIRIYTRFSSDKKSIFGFLRNISLSTLANKVKMNSRNDANYYESELKDLPQIDVEEENTQVFLTQVEGDIEHYNFLSSLKKIK